MEAKVQALLEAQQEDRQLIKGHIAECSDNYQTLKQAVDTVVAWAAPNIEKERRRADVWRKASDAVQTDWMIAILKWGPPLVALGLIAAIFPAARALTIAIFDALTQIVG